MTAISSFGKYLVLGLRVAPSLRAVHNLGVGFHPPVVLRFALHEKAAFSLNDDSPRLELPLSLFLYYGLHYITSDHVESETTIEQYMHSTIHIVLYARPIKRSITMKA